MSLSWKQGPGQVGKDTGRAEGSHGAGLKVLLGGQGNQAQEAWKEYLKLLLIDLLSFLPTYFLPSPSCTLSSFPLISFLLLSP